MKSKKDYLIIALICINTFFLTSILLHYIDPVSPAYGQVIENDYILTPCNMEMGKQMVWIIDLKTFQLTNCVYDASNNKIVFGQVSRISN